ncbi:lysophospholipase L2 [Tatumella morbirosei]|uniref:lysophospholipase L2 n=1 Tax=Tatumella morbirosei TaxID=642227 RepID=UPI00062A241E|nr:lysophospholipase L2 [Tatumella morbirosei]
MKQFTQRWLHREKEFSAFVTGPLLHFWRRRQEKSFTGTDGLRIRYVSFTSSQHTKAVLIAPGRIESYVKYPEVAYDLFQCGYDVFIIDHRGQGLSDRMLEDTHLGHVEHFSDYVDDLYRFWQITLSGDRYQRKFALAHSMGGAILTLLLRREPDLVDAAALLAPMFGIVLPMPEWMAERILNWTETRSGLREGFALGTGRWHAPPFAINTLTHSRVRYQRNLRFYADEPALQVGGPTAHWVRESLNAGHEILRDAAQITTPMLILQAEEDQVVENQAQNQFCELRQQAGHACEGGKPRVIQGARHEILFEKDEIRAQALNLVVSYFGRFETHEHASTFILPPETPA